MLTKVDPTRGRTSLRSKSYNGILCKEKARRGQAALKGGNIAQKANCTIIRIIQYAESMHKNSAKNKKAQQKMSISKQSNLLILL
ncbi:MAG: hypothetical protein MR763_07975 [Clostridiales bacterium]|nr:hypothetical protein [Clostridiales bacterium]